MTYTFYEYSSVSKDGEPLEPPFARNVAQAFGASVRLNAETVFVAVVPTLAMHLRIDAATGQAATTADHDLEAGKTYGFPVRHKSRPYLYGLAS